MHMNLQTPPTRKKKLNRYLGIGYITAGACFLFEPYVGIVDILPDCLGYLLMLIGFYRLSDLDDRLNDAAKGMRNLALLGLARIVAMFLAFGFVSPSEQPVFMLLALFTLAGLDCLVLIPMWKNISGGLLYMGSRYDATVMFDRRGLRGKNRTYNMVERYTATTVVFFILHEALAVLPEITVLSHEKGGAELGQGTHYYDFVGLFRVTGMAVSLILGVIWLILTIRFIHRLKGDKPFFERLTEKYRTDVLPCHDMWARRAVRGSMICLIVATALSLDFYLDGVNIVPDVASALLMLLSIWFIRKYAGKNIPAVFATIAYGISTAVTWVLQVKGYIRITDTAHIVYSEYKATFTDAELYTHWHTMVLLQALSAALFILAMGLIIKSLYRMVKRYTGLHAFREESTYAVERSEAIHKLIRKKLIIVLICAGLVALSTLFHWGVVPQLADYYEEVMRPGIQSVNAATTILSSLFMVLTEGYWFVDLAVGAILIGVTVSATGEISDQMEYSYMMND